MEQNVARADLDSSSKLSWMLSDYRRVALIVLVLSIVTIVLGLVLDVFGSRSTRPQARCVYERC
jgi:hypothetical protein